MRTLMKVMLVLTLIGLPGCQVAGPGHEYADLASLEKQILALIGDAPAESPESCKSIAFGSKPCGGPWRYLVYSAEHTDEPKLVRLVSTYNVLQEEANRDRGLASDCQFVSPPEITLESGYCRASVSASDSGI